MENVKQDLRQVEKEEVESSRMFDERDDDVQVFQSGSSSVPLRTAGRVENEEGDDGDGLMDNLQVVAPVFPVDTLLEEIGLKIFGMLSDEEVASCFRAYPKWQQWLSHQRTRFLFPEVVPLLLKYLPKTALLECRKVCRSWKDGLDNACQTHPQHLQVDSEDLISKDSIPVLSNRFDSANKITSFLQEMESHPGNPFPGRKLVLGWFFPDDLEEEEGDDPNDLPPLFEDFWNNSVTQLLDAFGHQVHSVFFDFQMVDWFARYDFDEVYNMNIPQMLGRCIEHLPNLKKLEIYGNINGWVMGNEVEVARRMRMQLPQLQLKNLETVAINQPHNAVIISILESYCDPNKIKRLDLHHYSLGGRSRLADALYGFQNLEVLDVQISLGDLERFRTLEQRPPLRKVVLRFCCPEVLDWHRFTAFQQIFTILELFAGTLKDAKLKSRNWSEEEGLTLSNDRKGFRINLPNLERLSCATYVGPLDPFIELPSLRNLDFEFNKMLPWEGSAVKLYGFEERMECSNIWSLIPSLKTLTIKGENGAGDFDKTYRRLFQRIICENGKEEQMI